MPTRTTPRTSRPSRPTRATRTAQTGRFARPTPATRPSLRRKPPQKSTADKALSGLVGLLPGSVLGRAAKAKPGSGGGGKGKKAGFALLAGAAGLALKKRNGRKTEEPVVPAPDPVATTPPVAPQTGPVTPV